MTHSSYTLPLTDAQMAAIRRNARREQAEAIAASGRALGRILARLLPSRAGAGSASPLGPRATGHAG